MEKSFKKILQGYLEFRKQYATGNQSVMQQLSKQGQQPEVMVVACCDSRVDPSVILQCDPGELFVVRNVANIIPPYEFDDKHHGTSAALEFGICFLHVKHLIILGHSQCGGIDALVHWDKTQKNDFISNWVSLIDMPLATNEIDACAKQAVLYSYENCLTFPWIKNRVDQSMLKIHRWFFNIQSGEIFVYSAVQQQFEALTI